MALLVHPVYFPGVTRLYLPELAPTPMMVVSLRTSRIPQPSRVPEILITPAASMALARAEQVVTVVPLPLPPPVVPAA